MPRRAGRIAAPLSVLVVACASAPADPPGVLPDYAMRERVAAVEVGQSYDEARALLGDAPVLRPGHPEHPYPTPLRALALTTPSGADVRVEVYVVATRPAEGCPDVQIDDVPIVFVDDAVAGKGWTEVERHWRGWGGSLEALRGAQEQPRCDATAEAPAP